MNAKFDASEKHPRLSFYLIEGDLPLDSQIQAERAARELLLAAGVDPLAAQTLAGFPEAFHLTGDDTFRMDYERWAVVRLWECAERAACAAAGVSDRMGRLTNYPGLADVDRQKWVAIKAEWRRTR